MKARVLVYPRREVLDPQAKAIHQALARLGFDDVVEVHAGKAYEIEVAPGGDAEARLRAMCDKLLANPIMERYSVELLAAGNGGGGQARAAAGAGKTKAGKAKGEKKAPAGSQAPGDTDATGGTAGGKPVRAKSPGTTPKSAPGAKKTPTKGSRP